MKIRGNTVGTTMSPDKVGDRIGVEYRHIRTYEHTATDAVKVVDITKDKDGNTFLCSDFMIILTLPTSQEIYDEHKTQFYIGKTLSWNDWIALFRQCFSRDTQRKWRIHTRHWYDGWWITDGGMSEDTNDYGIKDASSFTFGNIKSQAQFGEKINELHFMTTANIPVGTIIEVYGK